MQGFAGVQGLRLCSAMKQGNSVGQGCNMKFVIRKAKAFALLLDEITGQALWSGEASSYIPVYMG